MKILSAAQIRQAEQETMAKHGITPAQLMETAAQAAWKAMQTELYGAGPVYILCGPGNNGGDGLAIARLLLEAGKTPRIRILAAEKYSEEFNRQAGILFERGADMVWMRSEDDLPAFESFDYAIDALYGIGLARPLTGLGAALVEKLNESGCYVISLDLPSGMPADGAWDGSWPIVRADSTYTFEVVKLCLLLPDTGALAGEWIVIEIGLDPDILDAMETPFLWLEDEEMTLLAPPERPRFSHKGDFGHALLAGGQIGMCGAMVLATQAALRSGAGLVSVAVPRSGLYPLQTAAPEALCLPDPAEDHLTQLPDLAPYASIGFGPGLGKSEDAAKVLRALLEARPAKLILDADAINLLATYPDLLALLPEGTLLTPHVGELDRLIGPSTTSHARLERARAFASERKVIILLKGAYSALIHPDGVVVFNHTGNPGMATGGMGDVLTGLITGLAAQPMELVQAACLGMYIHGLAADLAAERLGQPALTAGAVVRHLGKAFRRLQSFSEMPDIADGSIPF